MSLDLLATLFLVTVLAAGFRFLWRGFPEPARKPPAWRPRRDAATHGSE